MKARATPHLATANMRRRGFLYPDIKVTFQTTAGEVSETSGGFLSKILNQFFQILHLRKDLIGTFQADARRKSALRRPQAITASFSKVVECIS
jgi:hypothetical protein